MGMLRNRNLVKRMFFPSALRGLSEVALEPFWSMKHGKLIKLI